MITTDREGLTEAIAYVDRQLRAAKDALEARDVVAAAKATDRAEHTMRFVRAAMQP